MSAMQFFTPDEFKCKCGRAACDAVPFDMATAFKLDALRLELGFPLVINCGVRCRFHNAAVGGEDDSQHLYGRAVDIASPSGAHMWGTVALAIKRGFTGIGIKKHMIHLDTRPGPAMFWGY